MSGTEKVEPEPAKATPAPMTVGATDDVAELDADQRADAALGWLAAQRPMDHAALEREPRMQGFGTGLGRVRVQSSAVVRRSPKQTEEESTETEGEQPGATPQIDKGTPDDPVVMGSAGGVNYMNIRLSRLNALKQRDRLQRDLATGAAIADNPLSTLFWGASRFLTDDPDKQAAAAQLGAAAWGFADGAAGVSQSRQQMRSVAPTSTPNAAAEVRSAAPSAPAVPAPAPARPSAPAPVKPAVPAPVTPAAPAPAPTSVPTPVAASAPAPVDASVPAPVAAPVPAPVAAPVAGSVDATKPSSGAAAPRAGKSPTRAPAAREKKELAKLIRSQQAELAAGDVGLVDVEPGQEKVLDLPEYQEGIAAASAAFARLTNIEDAKNIAATERSPQTRSGWSGDEAATDAVYHDGVKAGHETEPHRNDQGTEGRYECSHSERKTAVQTGETSLASSKPMCGRCQAWFGTRAQSEEQPHFVGDPGGVHVFLPDGRHSLEPHPSGAVTQPPPGARRRK